MKETLVNGVRFFQFMCGLSNDNYWDAMGHKKAHEIMGSFIKNSTIFSLKSDKSHILIQH